MPRTSLSRYQSLSAVDPVVPQAEASRAREVDEAVRLDTSRDRLQQLPRDGVHHIDHPIVAPSDPELLAVRGELHHVGGTPRSPLVGDLARGEVYDRDGAFKTVTHIQRHGIPRNLKAMRPF